MVIYFIHKASRLKGPSAVTDRHGRRLLKAGDVCIMQDDCSFRLIVLPQVADSWGQCRLLASETVVVPQEANTLLFAFDGLHARSGNATLLSRLADGASEATAAFLRNAADILTYHRDCWDGAVLVTLFAAAPKSANIPQMPTQKPSPTAEHRAMFISYLPTALQEAYDDMLHDGNPPRHCYEALRKAHPEAFRKALNRFLKAYPDKSIYD